jgi:hypothetical protein
VTDELGVTATDTTTVTVASGDGVPTVQILAPSVGAVGPGTTLTFQASATYPEDGTLGGSSQRVPTPTLCTLGSGEWTISYSWRDGLSQL